jgi:leucyl-tRNA synthetase
MEKFDHKALEAKWSTAWDDAQLFRARDLPGKRKSYVLDMFPYPSGQGLHVGHPLGYIASDIVARKRRMEGMEVLHPIGWDAFGLPAENYAIKTGVHPAESTAKNAANYRRQLRMLGLSYDWEREVDTSSPSYYRWTQWMFLFLYKKGLAEKRTAPVNWCGSCNTVLANEQVVDGKCERCSTAVAQKELSQWFFKVTGYADRLLDGLDRIDWPERIKAMQRNWIGRSEGAEITFSGQTEEGKDFSVTVFTTRPDTLYGVSYVVLAPEHPLVPSITAVHHKEAVAAYVAATKAKSELDRTSAAEKTGVALGANARHPLTGAMVPVWIADYALATYGTGAVMGVAAHDDRDHAFAKRYGLGITQVIAAPAGTSAAPIEDAAYTEVGIMVNSGPYDGLASEDAKAKITDELVAKGCGARRVNYHLRDWLISRQRYWGAPIPIVYCEECGEQPVPEDQLPVLLPDDVDFRPTGESPLTRSKSFHDVPCPQCGAKARRESDTMDTFVDSSWYFLRYPTPRDDKQPFDKAAVDRWLPVDLYVGGAEHAVLHLLYARFFTKALFDDGLLGFDEPFSALRNQGMILGENGEKMSKSRGNVVNPDSVVEEFGADTMRVYEMFMGEFTDAKPWSTQGIVGSRRFLDRVWAQVHETVHKKLDDVPDELDRALHRTVKKVGEDIEGFKFNTAVSAMMILLNEWQEKGGGSKAFAGTFVRLLAPFAPFVSEELWDVLGNEGSVCAAAWPAYDESRLAQQHVQLVLQVNGKVRDTISAHAGLTEDQARTRAEESDKLKAHLDGKTIHKVIVIQDKLVNFVVS